MLFIIFLIVAVWFLPLPQWLQICLTIFGCIFLIEFIDGWGSKDTIIKSKKHNSDDYDVDDNEE